MKEIAIMKKLRHPNVVQLLEVLNDNLRERIYMGTLCFITHMLGLTQMFCYSPSTRVILRLMQSWSLWKAGRSSGEHTMQSLCSALAKLDVSAETFSSV